MSAKIPNDQFLLFVFDTDASVQSVRADLLRNAGRSADLTVRFVGVPPIFGYPLLTAMRITDDHIVDHGTPGNWDSCLSEVATLFGEQVTPQRSPWALHLFESVSGAPRCRGRSLVAVLQISHALGDGRTVSAIARRLFGDFSGREPSLPGRGLHLPGELVRRSLRTRKFDRLLDSDTAAGRVPARAPGRPKIRVNVVPRGQISVRTVVLGRSALTAPGVSVTAGAMTVVSLALSRYLASFGDEVPDELGAEVTLAKTGERHARNHFRNAGVDLYPGIGNLLERAHAISSGLADRRTRAEHPAMLVQSAAAEMVPAVLTSWGVRQFDETAAPKSVTGNTVVSSVARGDDDLFLGGGRVRFTAGFPALSPVMGLTHGVHGIGDTVTIGITSAESAVPDPDVYEALVRDAADEVASVFSD